MLDKFKSYVWFVLAAIAMVLLSASVAGGAQSGERAVSLLGQVVIGALALHILRVYIPVLLLTVDYARAGYGTTRSRVARKISTALGVNAEKRSTGKRVIACVRDIAVVFYLLLAGLVFVPALYAVAVLLWRVAVESGQTCLAQAAAE